MARNCALDTSLLLTLGGAGALNVLWTGRKYAWVITPIVRAEVASEPTRSQLSDVVLDGRLTIEELDLASEHERSALAEWSDLVDAGEAETISIALARGWLVGVEDRYAQRAITRRVGADRWINAAALLIESVAGGQHSLGEAEEIFSRLDCYGGYRKVGVERLAQLIKK